MSFQITVLKVLAGHPGGCLPVDDLKKAVALLATSGSDWTDRMKRLSVRAPDLDIFAQSLVSCDAHIWRITESGRVMLQAIERPLDSAAEEFLPDDATTETSEHVTSAPRAMNFTGRRQRKSRRGRRRAGSPAA